MDSGCFDRLCCIVFAKVLLRNNRIVNDMHFIMVHWLVTVAQTYRE